MRFSSKLAMAVAAIFFAGSVSAHHKCNKNHDLGGKVYQVCKSWRADQGGPMPDNMMQHCRNVLCQFSEDEGESASTGNGGGLFVTIILMSRNVLTTMLGRMQKTSWDIGDPLNN